MSQHGWKKLVDGWPWYGGEGHFPVRPGSEFMAPLYVLRKPYGCWDPILPDDHDPFGWPVGEYEEALSIRPGLRDVAQRVLHKLERLCRGDAHGFDEYKLTDNPYWPPELAEKATALSHERFVLLMPVALSETQDDKARVRWTLYGGSEQGPARPFWNSFYSAPGVERPAAEGEGFLRHLLHAVYGEPAKVDLRAAGFRILPQGNLGGLPFGEETLPSWTAPYLLQGEQLVAGVKYLLTFRPFRSLPTGVQQAYFAGELHLLPFPGSLLFWGSPAYVKLQHKLPFAMQVPLLHALDRVHGVHGMRVPQSGWLHEPHGKGAHSKIRGPLRDTYKRTWRHTHTHRHDDELVTAREDKLAHVLFSSSPQDVGLYDKPMARNSQLWTDEFDLLLDGPHATTADVHRAADVLREGGMFGYRFITPAMRAGQYEIYWQRPLVAYLSEHRRCVTVLDGPLGYVTAYPVDRHSLSKPMELFPRMLNRPLHAENVALFLQPAEAPTYVTLSNVRKLVQSREMLGDKPLDRSFARQLLTTETQQTLNEWLSSLPGKAHDAERAKKFVGELEKMIAPETKPANQPPPSLTYERTANRAFEVAYWDAIADLSTGQFVNKNNADCIIDPATQAALSHHDRDLERMGDLLLERHNKAIRDAGMEGKALAGELPFVWKTEYNFSWMGGWQLNQEGKTYERNLAVVIPGRDRSKAVILADHYDTAYMHDHYDRWSGGSGARLSAAGADDNCSATAALLMAAPVFLEMSKQGKLGCDVWLVHLTGEEYPAEGLGTCHMCEELVEGTLKLRLSPTDSHDLSKVRIKGLYVMDMIAHNSESGPDVFQISPGLSSESLWLAYQAHVANRTWNESAPFWNQKRPKAERGKRRPSGRIAPEQALYLGLHGEIRPTYDFRSTLFNTDGQMYSDVGVPVVLFMENYDINRRGYHDSDDTLALIDLDYGAALAAICIEATARAATEEMPA
jgi:hypothetical protein